MDQVALEEKYNDLSSDSLGARVWYPNHGISDRPLYSTNYRNCNGVALLGENVGALTHFLGTWTPPELYLPRAIEEMMTKFGEEHLGAVVMGGDPQHFEGIISVLRSHSIPIYGSYLEQPKYGQDDRGNQKRIWSRKDMAINPVTKEVIMFSDEDGFVQLTPTPDFISFFPY